MANHLKAETIFPEPVRSELLRCARLRRDWVGWDDDVTDPDVPEGHYCVKVNVRTFIDGLIRSTDPDAVAAGRDHSNGHEYLAMLAGSLWMLDGPKVFRMQEDQERALANVAVNLRVADFRTPFPSLLVDLKTVAPFRAVLVHHAGRALVLSMISADGESDVTTVVKANDRPIEASLVKYDDTCRDVQDRAHLAARIGVNACLALTHFGHRLDRWLFEAERATDVGLIAKKPGDVAERARRRVALSPRTVVFDREVRLYRVEGPGSHDDGADETAVIGEKSTHWRRGHWAMVRCGEGRTGTRPAFREAVLVRADRLQNGDRERITTTYRS